MENKELFLTPLVAVMSAISFSVSFFFCTGRSLLTNNAGIVSSGERDLAIHLPVSILPQIPCNQAPHNIQQSSMCIQCFPVGIYFKYSRVPPKLPKLILPDSSPQRMNSISL